MSIYQSIYELNMCIPMIHIYLYIPNHKKKQFPHYKYMNKYINKDSTDMHIDYPHLYIYMYRQNIHRYIIDKPIHPYIYYIYTYISKKYIPTIIKKHRFIHIANPCVYKSEGYSYCRYTIFKNQKYLYN